MLILLVLGATAEDGELVRILFNSVGVCEMVPEYQQVIKYTVLCLTKFSERVLYHKDKVQGLKL